VRYEYILDLETCHYKIQGDREKETSEDLDISPTEQAVLRAVERRKGHRHNIVVLAWVVVRKPALAVRCSVGLRDFRANANGLTKI
jgi:hypothetical protein